MHVLCWLNITQCTLFSQCSVSVCFSGLADQGVRRGQSQSVPVGDTQGHSQGRVPFVGADSPL